MKRLALLLVISMVLSGCYNAYRNNIYYKSAFNYIKELPDIKTNCLSVSDTLINLELCNFYEEISEIRNLKEKDILFILDSIDNVMSLVKYHYPLLSKFNNSDSCTNTLFFSKLIDNMLLAEVINNRGDLSANHYKLTAFNKSTIFIFIFDSEKRISKVFSKELQYD